MKRKVVNVWAELSAKQDASQKVELSEVEKVELSSLAEIKQVQDRMNNLNSVSNDSIGRADKAIREVAAAKEKVRDSIRDMEYAMEQAKGFIQDGKSAMSSFNKMAKDLGLDAASSKEYKELQITVTNDMVDIIADSKEMLKELKSYNK